jgi:serine protease AprX
MKFFKKILSVFLFSLILSSFAYSQQISANNKYWVFLKDKKGVTFNPYAYFDAKTIERRLKFGIPLIDSTDFPINQEYYSTVAGIVDSTGNSTRWFNAIAVYATLEQVEKLKKAYFVQSVEPMQLLCIEASAPKDWDTTLTDDKLKILSEQISVMGGELFAEKGIDGKGLRIAIFDGGFPTVNTNPAFEHIRKDGRILKTWDFTKNKEFVYSYNPHGCEVMSCIGGMINGKKIGMATGAEFLLARTEVNSEPFSEEENWLAASEWADKNGVDIINSSLGYTYHRYFTFQMDGKSTLVTRAANMAAKKGMLVVNAAGNDGDNDWKLVGAPADADSVLSVGGINPWSGYHTSFSSFGPTWDMRMKPNVCAYGHVTAAAKEGLVSTQGTSFASPLVAGFAACAWQNNRDWNNMQMYLEIEKSGDLYPYFDYAHGFGVPQAIYFVNKPSSETPTFEFVKTDSSLKVVVKPEFIDKSDQARSKYLYYNIQKENNVLSEYNVVIVNSEEALVINTSLYKKGQRINVHYRNYTATYLL